MGFTERKALLLAIGAAAVALTIGVIAGYYGRGESYPEPDPPKADPDISKLISDDISNTRIGENLRKLTESPHIAGRRQDEVELVNFIADSYRAAGLTTEIHPYNVLLSYPDDDDSNYVAVKLADDTLVDKSQAKEAILDASQNKPGIVNPFNAYSKSGDPEGDLVYVNYGTIEDFIAMEKKINLTGKICIARYGQIFRGDKALHAEQYKCAGLILYSDPKDYTVAGQGVYPDDWFLPGTGAQRGTLFKQNGDPLTLHYPSIDSAWRLDEDAAPLPNIPVTPIGYDDAVKYLSKMAGDEVEEDWKGGLNITYRYGPGFDGANANSKMTMHVTTQNERKITHNVIGYIRGFDEPDRYVIVGNHRDAWVFGAMDPSSGTAAVLEVARSLGEAVKGGWRPRRTIMFCAWGAEEYALIGSAEWVEEFQKVLGQRTVAYINADTVVMGKYRMNVRGSGSLRRMVFEAAKLVPNPNNDEVNAGRTNTYDTWYHVSGNKEPSMSTLGSGSDYTMFLQLTGITCLDVAYERDPALGIASYPVYHSVYETFDLVNNVVDPGFKYHQAAARIVAEMTRNLADEPLLPFDIEEYVARIKADMEVMLLRYGDAMRTSGSINTDDLVMAVDNLTASALEFHSRLTEVDAKKYFRNRLESRAYLTYIFVMIFSALALRSANDQLMLFERAFIDKNGIEGRNQYSHVVYAPSLHDTYGGAAFPGLVDSMFEIGDATDPRWEEVRRQYSILLYHIGSAASTLEDVVPISGYSNKHSGYHFEDS